MLEIPPKIYNAAQRVAVSMRAENSIYAVPDYSATKEYDDVLAIADWIKNNYTVPPVVKLSLLAETIIQIIKNNPEGLAPSQLNKQIELQIKCSETEFKDVIWQLIHNEILDLTLDRKLVLR